jgi:hypothetical protein
MMKRRVSADAQNKKKSHSAKTRFTMSRALARVQS